MIRKTIVKYDLISAPASLRIKGETAYGSICGGISSVLVLLFFIVAFIILCINLLQLQNIVADSKIVPDEEIKSSITDFYFMLGLTGLKAF